MSVTIAADTPDGWRSFAITAVVSLSVMAAALIACISGRGTPVSIGLIAAIVTATIVIERHAWRWGSWTPAAVATMAFFAYASLSCLWTAEPLGNLAQVGAAVAFLVLVLVLADWLRGQLPARTRLIGFWLAFGFAIGILFLAVEVTTGQGVKRAFFNAYPFFRPTNIRYFEQIQGVIVGVSPNDLNRGFTAAVMLLWPAVACLLPVLGETRWRLPALLLGSITTFAIFASEHESSKLALVCGAAAWLLHRFWPRHAGRLVMAGWIVAVLGVLPAAYIAFNAKVYLNTSLHYSARDRIVLWGHTVREYLKAPVLGIGADATYDLAIGKIGSAPSVPDADFKLTTGRHAHNAYLQVWYELGAVGALPFLVAGIATIASIQRMPGRLQRYGLATYATGMGVILPSWGVWQTWFLAVFALTAIALVVAWQLEENRATRGAAGGNLSVLDDLAAISPHRHAAALATVAALLAGLLLVMSRAFGPASPPGGFGASSEAILKALVACRDAGRSDCAGPAAALAKRLVGGDTRGFTLHGARQFGVYLAPPHIVYTRFNCSPRDVAVDDFSLNVWPRDTAVLTPERRPHGFASLDFSFKAQGWRAHGYCLALVTLPFADVAKLSTGQYLRSQGLLWRVDLSQR